MTLHPDLSVWSVKHNRQAVHTGRFLLLWILRVKCGKIIGKIIWKMQGGRNMGKYAPAAV